MAFISSSFRKTIFISAIGHITVFSIFNFTFGMRIPRANYAYVSFLGSILRHSDLSNLPFSLPLDVRTHRVRLEGFNKRPVSRELNRVDFAHFKPRLTLAINAQKSGFIPARESITFLPKRKEPSIMLYPHLPYHFLLYFKDRQMVHIELMFNIISSPQTNTILIKRKISSGNLEADLHVMRYISHYLFIQHARFIPHKWQTVKIDLSVKND